MLILICILTKNHKYRNFRGWKLIYLRLHFRPPLYLRSQVGPFVTPQVCHCKLKPYTYTTYGYHPIFFYFYYYSFKIQFFIKSHFFLMLQKTWLTLKYYILFANYLHTIFYRWPNDLKIDLFSKINTFIWIFTAAVTSITTDVG